MIDTQRIFLNNRNLDCFVRNWNVDMQLHADLPDNWRVYVLLLIITCSISNSYMASK